mgnify:FL=1
MDIMINKKKDFPLEIRIGFKKVFDAYREKTGTTAAEKRQATEILDIEKECPLLSSGINDFKNLSKFQDQIDTILNPLFPSVLGENEIKFATIPFQDVAFKSTSRYQQIVKAAGNDFSLDIINFDDDQFYIMGCSIILNKYYGKKVDFKRSFYYNIPDQDGTMKNYRMLYNADFVDIQKTEMAKDISEDDMNELLESFEDVSVWKEKFPPQSWIFNGFLIATLTDVTTDVSLSEFKSNLLRLEKTGGFHDTEFSRIFRSIFSLKDLLIGFTDYNDENEAFERVLFKDIPSFILCGKKSQLSKDALCSASYYTIFKQKEFYCVTDAERYHKLYPENLLYKKILDQGMKSAIFAAIVSEEKILGSENFSQTFVSKYVEENILDINPKLL